jgi:2-keto-4-pentenoate hydratase/2-oxohepta-3-ene-1,7-dioic acid hydratase in catechol pathway
MNTPDRWVRFETAEGPRHGYVSDASIVPITGDLFGEWQRARDPVPLAGARLLAPVIPPTFYACGINYEGHWRTAAEEFGLSLEKTWPQSPEIGYRAQSAIIGSRDAIVLPADAPPNVQAEGELAVVIGKRAKHLSVAEAPGCIFGYTICNDVSARGWQFQDRTFWRSKNSDTFKPLGPWIQRNVDLASLVTRVRVNGAVRETFRTNEMIHSIADYIAAMTRYITLVPGDVIIMGTDGRCPQIHSGDTVSIEIDGIGALTNPVIRNDTL